MFIMIEFVNLSAIILSSFLSLVKMEFLGFFGDNLSLIFLAQLIYNLFSPNIIYIYIYINYFMKFRRFKK